MLWSVKEAACSSKMLEPIYQTPCHMSDNDNFKNYHHKSLISHTSDDVPKQTYAIPVHLPYGRQAVDHPDLQG